MGLITKDAERIRKPKLPKHKVLKKRRKRLKYAYDGGDDAALEAGQRKKGTTFCPKCGSTDIFWASGLPHLWSIWDCRNCGYRGALIVSNGKMAEKIREDYENKKTRQ